MVTDVALGVGINQAERKDGPIRKGGAKFLDCLGLQVTEESLHRQWVQPHRPQGKRAKLSVQGRADYRAARSDQDFFLNRVGARKNWIQLRLTGTDSSRDAVGTRLTLTTAAGSQTDQVTGGGSYLSAGDPRAHFGLGEAARVEEIRIRWPSGKEEVLRDIPANRILQVTEGRAAEFSIGPGPRPAAE